MCAPSNVPWPSCILVTFEFVALTQVSQVGGALRENLVHVHNSGVSIEESQEMAPIHFLSRNLIGA